MLKLFEVNGFKNFQNPIVLNLTDVRDYKFNRDYVNDGLISKLIIYGKNAVGKSNFGLALFDLSKNYVLLDEDYFDPSYLNTLNPNDFAEFRYVFQFGNQQIEYLYRRSARKVLVYERILIDDERIFEYDRENPDNCKAEGIAKLSPTLLLDFDKVDSAFNYVVSNIPLDIEHPLRQAKNFIDKMRLHRSSADRKTFVERGVLPSFFDDKDVLAEFEGFLNNLRVQSSQAES